MSKEQAFIITGGVYSALGKGVLTAALSSNLNRNYRTKIIKVDPYLNYSARYLNPREHGEVFVTSDGYESDLDLGRYEKFLSRKMNSRCNVTGGQINHFLYNLGLNYRGKTLTLELGISELVKSVLRDDFDIVIFEFGGTIDDRESHWVPIFYKYLSKRMVTHHVHMVPMIENFQGELKTKPIQVSIKYLHTISMKPDILAIRTGSTGHNMNDLRSKLEYLFSGKIIFIKNLDIQYKAIRIINKQLGKWLGERGMVASLDVSLSRYTNLLEERNRHLIMRPRLRVLIVNKYGGRDSFWNLFESLSYTRLNSGYNIEFSNLDIALSSPGHIMRSIRDSVGIVLPGGFDVSCFRTMEIAFLFARSLKIPILGICFGQQLILNRFLREVTGRDYFMEEINPKARYLSFVKGQFKVGEFEVRFPSSKYVVRERFRNRYHLNPDIATSIREYEGLDIIALSSNIPVWFRIDEWNTVACQFHPEFNSYPLKPHIIFLDFILRINLYARKNEDRGTS